MFVGLAKSTLLCFIIVINLILCFHCYAYIELVVIMRKEHLMYFRIRNYIGTQGEDLSTVKTL